MAHGKSLEMRRIQPRVYAPTEQLEGANTPRWKRRERRSGRHVRSWMQSIPDDNGRKRKTVVEVRMTQPRPWVVLKKRRKAAAVARASRKQNR